MVTSGSGETDGMLLAPSDSSGHSRVLGFSGLGF
jgi:hypothetical protein